MAERRTEDRRAIERATPDRRAAVERLVELREQIEDNTPSRARTLAWQAAELRRRTDTDWCGRRIVANRRVEPDWSVAS